MQPHGHSKAGPGTPHRQARGRSLTRLSEQVEQQGRALEVLRQSNQALEQRLHAVERSLPTQEPQRAPPEAGVHPHAQELEGRTALLVDGNALSLFSVTSLLEHQRMRVLSTSSFEEGMAALRENPDVEILLMDLPLQGVAIDEATRAVHALTAHERLPIVALSAAVPGDRERQLEAGCSGSLPLPIDPARLLSLMTHSLRRAAAP